MEIENGLVIMSDGSVFMSVEAFLDWADHQMTETPPDVQAGQQTT